MTDVAHAEIEDEYQLDLLDGVEDETEISDTSRRDFSITSYGADYTVDSLVKRMRAGAFIIPEFQRKFVWSQRHASKFIESLLMGLPVPGIFLYKDVSNNKHLVIDGQQRLTTLRAFYDGLFGERKFRLLGISDTWNDKTYEQLDPSDQLKLDDSIVHATIFQQDQPKDVLDSIYFVFERINSGGIRLSPQEIRNCVSHGPVLQLVKKLNENDDWRHVFGPENKRLKDQELILRFLAMFESSGLYRRPMAGFLNDFIEKQDKEGAPNAKAWKTGFEGSLALIRATVGEKAFRLVRAFNAAVFEAVMVGVARRLAVKPLTDQKAFGEAYRGLLDNLEFRQACEQSTADEENVSKRIRLATEAFAGV